MTKTTDKVMNVFEDITGFIRHYGDELANITGILKTLVIASPIFKKELAIVIPMIERLEQASNNIMHYVENVKEPSPVIVRKEDIDAAVAKYLKEKDIPNEKVKSN